MIITIIISFAIKCLGAVLQAVVTGNIDIDPVMPSITNYLNFITNWMVQGRNLLYYLFGDLLEPMVILIIAMLIFKYLAFPILVIIRRIFIKGGDT